MQRFGGRASWEINAGTSQPVTGSNCGDRVWKLALDLRASLTPQRRLRQGSGPLKNQQLQSEESHHVCHSSSKQSEGNDSAWSSSLSATAGVQAVEAKWPNKEQKGSCLHPPVSDEQARPAAETLQIPEAGLHAEFMLHSTVRKNQLQLLYKYTHTSQFKFVEKSNQKSTMGKNCWCSHVCAAHDVWCSTQCDTIMLKNIHESVRKGSAKNKNVADE